MKIMDALYAPFRIKETALTAGAIRRMKVCGILAIPAFPCVALVEIMSLSDMTQNILMTISLVSGFFLFIAAFNPIMNTLSRTNKNLDEWEIRHKLAAESFALRALLLPLVIGLIILSFTGFEFSKIGITNVEPYHLGWLAGGLVVYVFLSIWLHLAWTIKPLNENE